MSSSTPSNRTCWQCQTPIHGRADKKFCTSACKASYSREADLVEAAPTPAAISRPQPTSRPSHPQPAQEAAPVPAPIDWQARCEQAEQTLQQYQQQAQHSQQAAVPCQEYHRLGQLMQLHSTTKQWTVYLLHEVLYQLQAGIMYYQQHPGLTDPLHVAHRRLQDMYNVSDHLQRNVTELLEREEERRSDRAS